MCAIYQFSFLVSITEVLPGDIVFLTSDGISDNFDPVVSQLDPLFSLPFSSTAHLNLAMFRLGSSVCRRSRTDKVRPEVEVVELLAGNLPGAQSKSLSSMDSFFFFLPDAFFNARAFDHNTLLQTWSRAGLLADC